MKYGIGEILDRPAIHAVYGGRPQGRISPAKTSGMVLLFIDPAGDERRGQPCGMGPDGCLHFTAEGSSGDHRIKGGNISVAEHVDAGKPLHVFVGVETGPRLRSPTKYRYAGEFRVAGEEPFYRLDVPETETHGVREGIVFRLDPVGAVWNIPSSQLAVMPGPSGRTWSRAETDWFAGGHESPAARAVAASFIEWSRRQGDDPRAFGVVPEGERQEVVAPLFDAVTGTVFCPTGSSSRAAIRNAIGEALDMKRLAGADDAVLLLATPPREDVFAMVEHARVGLRWQIGEDWVTHEPSADVDRRDAPGLRHG